MSISSSRADSSRLRSVIEAARHGRLAVLAGAGISMLPPSNLPSWSEFTGALLSEAVAKAATAPFLDQDSISAIRSLTADSIRTASLSEAISKYVASISYFPVLTVLDGTETNANHQALAELAERGALCSIVTPNFDTLVERAFQERRVPWGRPNPHSEASRGCVLIHIHGVATSARSMIDTVGQKARGLPFATHAALQHGLRDRRVLVVGFSGLDLDFAADYLSLESLPLEGVCWVVRPRSTPPPPVLALRERLGNRVEIVEGALPALWRELGSTVSTSMVAGDPEQAAAVAARVHAHVQRLFETLGAPCAVALCMRLLDDNGQRDRARQVYICLERFAGTWSNPHLASQLTVLRALSSTNGLTTGAAKVAWQERDVECCRRVLTEWRKTSSEARAAIVAGRVRKDRPVPFPFEGVFDESGWRNVHRGTEDELHFLLAIGLGNLAMSYASMDKLGSAERAMWEALDHALLAADLRALAGAWYAYGIIQLRADEPPSSILWWLLVAESAAVAGGNVDNAFAACVMRAQLLMIGGEYTLAADCLERAEQRAALSARRELRIQAVAWRAVLACRRHGLTTSLHLFDEAVALADGIADWMARVRWQRVELFCHEPAMRDAVLADCDAVLSLLGSGVIDDPSSGVPDVSMIEAMKANVKSVREYATPPFVAMEAPPDGLPEAARLRQLLINCEYFGDRTGVATLLKRMTELKLQAGDDNPRAEELAAAYVQASEHLDIATQFDALMLFSQAVYRLGDLTRAREAMRRLERIELAFDPEGERRKRAWLTELSAASPQPMHPYLLIRGIAEGAPALRFSPEDRQRTAASLAESAPAIAQILICQLAQEYRDAGDRVGVAGCYALLARTVRAARQALAADLDCIALELGQ